MDKSILVIDTPEYCTECPLCCEDRMTYRDYCRITGDYIWTTEKPDWCPLKPMPKKVNVSNDDIVKAESDNAYEVGLCMFNKGYLYGHNNCIYQILR